MTSSDINHELLGAQLRALREATEVSQVGAAEAIGVSQPTYSRIETGDRPLKGDELVILADLLGVRAGAITGVAQLRQEARLAARTDDAGSQKNLMRDKLFAYLELDGYLTSQGLATA